MFELKKKKPMHIKLFAWGHYSDGCGSKKNVV